MVAMGGFAAEETPAARAAAEGGASCDQWNTKEFFQAATVEEVATCLKQGFDPQEVNQYGQTVLHTAAGHSPDPGVIAALVAAGADPKAPDKRGWAPLEVAAAFNANPEMIAALVDAGADPKARGGGPYGRVPLERAAMCNANPDIMAALFEAGADPNERGNHGSTPLHWAAQRNPNLKS